VLLLVLDPARLGVEVRWEPGVPGDPESMRFPHAYGPVPTAAVVDVLPYPPADGVFVTPTLPPMDPAARAARLPVSIVRRMATAAVPVAGGVALRTAPVPFSYQHNALFLDAPVDAATVVAEADRALVGLDHRAVALFGDALADTAIALGRRGWSVDAQAGVTARPTGVPTGRVEQVDLAAVRPLWDDDWRRAGLPEAAVAQLSDRYTLEEQVVDVRYLAVRDGGDVVAAAVLKLDGATAALDAVGTDPAHRGRGHGDALVAEALALAAAAGADVIGLDASLDDWPRHWYARRGFVETGRSWFAVDATR
jgi:GNAT superfamily N-acetyltransferase